jgi:hypothetical protein
MHRHQGPTCFYDQAQQAVGVEDEVGGGGAAVADDGVHAADLKVAGDDLQVVEDAPQVVLLQLQRSTRAHTSVALWLAGSGGTACSWY